MGKLFDDAKIPDFLTKKEAIYLLGKLRLIECTECPDYYHGCEAGVTRTEMVAMSLNDWIYKYRRGGDGFLCHKLRTVANMGLAKEKALNQKFKKGIKKDLIHISTSGDLIVQNIKHENSDEDTKKQIREIQENYQKALQTMDAKYKAIIKNLKDNIVGIKKEISERNN